MGVLEYHRAIRSFCLNYYDFKILSKEEIIFCNQMDNISIMFNKLKYYNFKFCKKYEKEAIILVNSSRKHKDQNSRNNTEFSQ